VQAEKRSTTAMKVNDCFIAVFIVTGFDESLNLKKNCCPDLNFVLRRKPRFQSFYLLKFENELVKPFWGIFDPSAYSRQVCSRKYHFEIYPWLF
jgi:hypothetical protein